MHIKCKDLKPKRVILSSFIAKRVKILMKTILRETIFIHMDEDNFDDLMELISSCVLRRLERFRD